MSQPVMFSEFVKKENRGKFAPILFILYKGEKESLTKGLFCIVAEGQNEQSPILTIRTILLECYGTPYL